MHVAAAARPASRESGDACAAEAVTLAAKPILAVSTSLPHPTTMAYNDPYYSQPHQQFPPQPEYTDAPQFDPYNQNQRHPTYDQSGYGGYTDDDDGFARRAQNDAGVGAERPREKGQYDDAGFPPVGGPER